MKLNETSRLKANIADLEESYFDLIQEAVFKPDAFQNKFHLGVTPFNPEQSGDFLYVTNRKKERYSYLYSELDPWEIHNTCTIPMGYTSLLVCKSITYLKGQSRIGYDFSYENTQPKNIELTGKYCVFQDPFTKLKKHGYHDIIDVFNTQEEALKFANKLKDEKDVSTLTAWIKEMIHWH